MGVISIRHYGVDQGREHLPSPKGSSRSHIPQTDEVRTELNNDNAWRFKKIVVTTVTTGSMHSNRGKNKKKGEDS